MEPAGIFNYINYNYNIICYDNMITFRRNQQIMEKCFNRTQKNMKYLVLALLLMGSVIGVANAAPTQPPLPTSYWGYAMPNTLITVLGAAGNVIASATSNSDGSYLVIVPWDDPATTQVEGAVAGQIINFKVSGKIVTSRVIDAQGTNNRLDIGVTTSRVDDVALLQSNGWWAMKYNFNSATNGNADKWLSFGDGTGKPVVGDFRHTGTPSDVALLQSNGWWAIKYDFINAPNSAGADKWIAFGDGTAKPVVGDFDHDGFKDDVALLQSNGWWAIKYDFINATNFAGADKWIAFGDGTAKPVVGDFNGDGFADDVALLQSNGWWAIKYNFNSASNFAGADKWIAFGDGTGQPVVGNFNNN
jgi:hypothetical protein